MAAVGQPPNDPDLFKLVGQTLEGRFRIDRVVAEGGFGVVYDAWHLVLEYRVAVKVLKTPDDMNETARGAFIEKFIAEAKVMARMSHSHIVRVIDTGVSDMPAARQAPWMAMEWLSGPTLEDWFREKGAQPPERVMALMKPVLEAIAYAHDEGVAHRDIKPENIMLVETKRGPWPRVLDFGIAKLMREGESAGSGVTRTQSRSIAFSPSYSSPEQITHTRTGPWTDVHALGLVFTEALTGKPPLPVYELSETYREVLSGVRPTPAKFGMDVGAWEPVLAKAVAYRPDERYQTAGALLAALLEAMPGARHQALKPGERVSSAPVSAPAPAPVSMPMAAPAGPATLAPPPGSLEPRKVTSAFAGVVLTEPPKAPGPSRTTLIAGAVLVLGIGGAVAMVVAATRSTDPSVGVPSATATPTATEAPTATAMMTAEPTATVFVPSPLGTMMPTASTGVPLRGPVGRPGPRGR